jgi:tRNA A-37 threonylcarbamoyl transferase component Bud32
MPVMVNRRFCMFKVDSIDQQHQPEVQQSIIDKPDAKTNGSFLNHNFISRHFKKNQSLVKRHQEKKKMQQNANKQSATNLTQVIQSAASKFHDIGNHQLKQIVERLDYRIARIFKDNKHESVCLIEKGQKQFILKLVKAKKMDAVTRVYRNKLENEHQILSQLTHDSLYPAVQAYSQFPYPHFLLEYASGDSLQQVLDLSLFTLSERLYLSKQVLQSLFGLQRKNIIHNDLSLDNYLLDRELGLKLIGFHDAETIQTNQIQNGARISKLEAECFQCGTMLYYILTGKTLCPPTQIVFRSQLQYNPYEVNLKQTPEGEDIPKHIADMVASLIAPNPNVRVTSLAHCIDQWC